MNKEFEKDLFRYGKAGKISLKDWMLFPLQIKYLYYFRKAKAAKNYFLRRYYELRLRHISNVSNIQIPVETQIGEGFYIGHFGAIVINSKAVLGKNVNVAVGVTIGQTNRGKKAGAPQISDRCWIGSNAVIVGNVRIGTDVLIAPGAYVNFDVPDHSIVIGNPGKIICRENATEGYVNNLV